MLHQKMRPGILGFHDDDDDDELICFGLYHHCFKEHKGIVCCRHDIFL